MMTSEAAAAKNEYQRKYARNLSPEAKEARRQYHRNWQRNNKEKLKQYMDRYWQKKAEAAAAEQTQRTAQAD